MGGESMALLLQWLWPWRWHALVGLACVCAHAAAARAAEALWWRPRRLERHFARHGVRGPPYRFFVGNSVELVRLMGEAAAAPVRPPTSHDVLPRVLAFYHHWRKIYGPKFLIWFGSTLRLVISDLDLIREILLSRSEYFDRYEAPPLIRQFEGFGLTNLHGDKWAHHRKILNPAFHAENLKLLVPFVGETVLEMVQELSATASASSGEVEVDVAQWYGAVAENTIAFCTFGRNYGDGRVVFQLQTKLMAYAAEAHSRVFIPGYRFLPTKNNRHSWQLDKEIRRNLARFIRERQSGGDEEGLGGKVAGGSMKDLMSFMVRRPADGHAPAMSAEETIAECKNFFFAGKETTSNLLTWTTVLLAMHPEWQERARREVVDVCGARGLPSKDQLSRLKTLGMVLNETLRLYPPAVAMVRKARADVELGGCVVPRGTEVLIPIMAIHHDKELWGPDATQFNPGRFAAGASRAARHPLAFMPFGMGARSCIGQDLAMLEAKVAMAVVLQRLSFRLAPSYVHAPAILIILNPQHGAPVIFRALPPQPPDLAAAQ